jgi:D-amino peptidase
MRLYISADMEGIAGVCAWPQVDPSNRHEYPIYRRYMTREVSAAITGAREAGATDVVVNDSHWNMSNLLWDELPENVRVITGTRKPLSMSQGAQERFHGAFFTGYHGKIGDQNAVLSHTYSNETFYNVTVNGEKCSEAMLTAAMLGYYGTPLLMITGDRTIVDETTAKLPWVLGVCVKDAIGYFAANTLTPQAACDAIREGARDALGRLDRAKTFTFPSPVELAIETVSTEQADFVELLPRFERIGGRVLRYRAQEYPEAFRAFLVAMRLGGAANAPA